VLAESGLYFLHAGESLLARFPCCPRRMLGTELRSEIDRSLSRLLSSLEALIFSKTLLRWNQLCENPGGGRCFVHRIALLRLHQRRRLRELRRLEE